jgi:hypothetical protein
MEPIKSLLRAPRPKKPVSERAELLQFFLDKVNAARRGTKYKPLRPAALAVKLSHLKLPDLYYLKSVCEDAERRGKPFSAIFWWSLKAKDDAAQMPR